MSELSELRRSWTPPPELAGSGPREVRLKTAGKALAVMAAALFVGAIAADLGLSRLAQSLPRRDAGPVRLARPQPMDDPRRAALYLVPLRIFVACAMEVSSHALALRRVDGTALRRRRLHQPDARPPRLPRRHGGVLRAPSAGCSRCCPTARRRRSTSTIRAAPTLVAAARPAGDLRDRRAPPTSRPGPLSFSLDGLAFDVAHAARHAARPLAAGRPAERLQHPRRGRPRRWRSTCRSPRSKRGIARARAACPAASRSSPSADDDVTRRRRLRAHRRRAEEPARDGAAAGARAG